MNKSMQIRNLRKLLGSKADLFDLDARVDGRLSYEENKRIILSQAKKRGISKKTPISFKGSPLYLVDKAEQIFKSLSPRKKAQDLVQTAKKSFNPRVLTYEQFLIWKKNPSRYDIIGVDSKRTRERKIKAKKLTLSELRKIESDLL
jgi:hypothetical protein